MPAKAIRYGAESRSALVSGVNKLADALRVTLGPRGRCVGLEKKYGAPQLINDGVTIAKEIELPDRFENLGAALLREASTKTNDEVGDGTTTSVVLAQAMVREGMRLVAAGANPMAMKRGIDKAVEAIVAELQRQARKVKDESDAIRVATVAANDPQIGEVVGKTVWRVGKEGVVTVEEGKGTETTVEDVEGLRFDKGYISPYFVTNPETMEVVYEDPLILFHEKKISSVADFLPLLEKVARTGRPFIVIAEDVESEALAVLVLNRLRGALKCAAVKAPGFGERRKAMLEDMAILTGGQLISEDLGMKLESVEPSMLGTCRRIVITKDHTTIIGGKGKKSAIEGRINQIKRQLETTESSYDREKLSERLAKLSGGVAVVQVGASTETEMKEKKSRIEDAIHATQASLEEGVVPGGGLALLRARKVVDKLDLPEEEKVGAEVVKRAVTEPARVIAHNAGADGDMVVARLLEEPAAIGYDAITGEFCDLAGRGILDPAKVVRLALQNAASIAGMIITTEAAVAEIPEEEKPHTPPPY
jgi:chaperonin GroEL